MPGGGSSTRPPKSSQRTPSSRHTFTTSPTAFPSVDERSRVPSPVTTRSAERAWPAKSIRSSTTAAPETSLPPSDASAAPKPTGRTRAGQLGVRAQLRHPGEPRLELVHLLRSGALLRAERSRGASLPEQRVADVTEDLQVTAAQRFADDLEQPGSAVDRRRIAEPDEDRPRGLASDRHEHLAKAATRGLERVELRPARAGAAPPPRPPRRPPTRPPGRGSAPRPRGRAGPKQGLSSTRRRGSLRRPPPCFRRRPRQEAPPPRGRRRASRPPGPSPPRARTGRPCS